MPKKKTQEEIISEFRNAHELFYDYSQVEYINSTEKVIVLCPIHSVFKITPAHHKNGVGCKKCYVDSQKTTKDQFIKESQKHFGSRYDYSLFEEMPRVGRKIKIICTEHDETFEQEPRSHMRGHTGCYECKVNKLSGIKGELGKFKSQSELNKSFIEQSIEVHGQEYDYSKFNYVNSGTDGTIVCKVHGDFSQTPGNHLKGTTPCHACSIEKKKEFTFKKKCKEMGVDYYRALKRRQAGLSEEKIFSKGYIRSEREVNQITVFNEIYPNIEEAVRKLKPPASSTTISRWISEGISAEEAFERIPNPGYADGIIYLITNTITQLQYVGLTVQTLDRRWRYHVEHAKAGHIKNEESLHAAIRKHGENNFKIREIDKGTTKKNLEEKEIKWIRKINTLIPNGYNISAGGVSGGSNKKPTIINGVRFKGVREATEYLSELKGISLSAAKKRISCGRINVNKPAKAGESVVKTKVYRAWSQIIHGVTNPKSKDFKPDLDVIESWKDFKSFRNDVGEPTSNDMAFTRLNKKKGYFPENCVWLTKSEASKVTAKYMKENGLLVGRGKSKNG